MVQSKVCPIGNFPGVFWLDPRRLRFVLTGVFKSPPIRARHGRDIRFVLSGTFRLVEESYQTLPICRKCFGTKLGQICNFGFQNSDRFITFWSKTWYFQGLLGPELGIFRPKAINLSEFCFRQIRGSSVFVRVPFLSELGFLDQNL